MSGYAFWYHCSSYCHPHPNTYEWLGTYQIAGYGPDTWNEFIEAYMPSDLILMHGPSEPPVQGPEPAPLPDTSVLF